jgi:hypothetical protein
LDAHTLHGDTFHTNKLAGHGKRLHGWLVVGRVSAAHTDGATTIALPLLRLLIHAGASVVVTPSDELTTVPEPSMLTHGDEHVLQRLLDDQYAVGQGTALQASATAGFATAAATHGASLNSSRPLEAWHCTVRYRRPRLPHAWSHAVHVGDVYQL